MKPSWSHVVAVISGLMILTACSSSDLSAEPALMTAASECTAAATDPQIAGGGEAELVRSEETTQRGLASWLASRHGPDGPSQTAPPSTNPPDSLVYVCVYRLSVPRQISVPAGSTAATDGIRVFTNSGRQVTLDAIGDPDRLAQDLDSL